MEKKVSFFTEKDGKKSMTRLLSFFMFFYFCLSNTVILISVFNGKSDISINTLMFILVHDFLVLLAIYAPKALSKIEEVKELIQIVKDEK